MELNRGMYIFEKIYNTSICDNSDNSDSRDCSAKMNNNDNSDNSKNMNNCNIEYDGENKMRTMTIAIVIWMMIRIVVVMMNIVTNKITIISIIFIIFDTSDIMIFILRIEILPIINIEDDCDYNSNVNEKLKIKLTVILMLSLMIMIMDAG